MSYTVFARKYRPQDFEQVVGQEPIVTTLRNAIKQGKVAHAYLFTGPRGVGKTSVARILAKALNCEKGPTGTPCNGCDICRCISEGRDMDVIEIDGASNRGIDEVRTIRENVKYLPSRSKYKIYIIDEVHMLTKEAFNALLKTLEEPPSHVKFFFATTAPHKLPETVQSRCQRFDFRNIGMADIVKRLAQIARQEKIDIEEEALRAIARYAKGGLRDSQSLLDQLNAFSDGKITLGVVQNLLGTVSEEKVEALVGSLTRKDAPAALKIVHEVIEQGRDWGVFIDQTIWYLRDLMVTSACGYDSGLLENPWRERELLEKKGLSQETLMYMISVLSEVKRRARDDLQERILLEMAVVKLARMEDLRPLGDILKRLEELEGRLSVGRFEGTVKESVPEPQITSKDPEKAPPADVQEVWAKILFQLKEKRPPTWSRLKEGRLLHLGKEEMVVEFPKGRPFSKRSLEGNAEERQLVEECVEAVVGWRPSLRLVLSADSKTGDTGPSASREAGSDPLKVWTNKALDIFGGKEEEG
jgi:DNA polymerase-3 subunit gamma/tau